MSVYHYQSFCHNLSLFKNISIYIYISALSILICFICIGHHMYVLLHGLFVFVVCVLFHPESGCCVALLNLKMSFFLMDCMCE